MKYSYQSTLEAVARIHPHLMDLKTSGHIRMDLPTLLDKSALEYFMKFCGTNTPQPGHDEMQASINIHEALSDLQKEGHITFGTQHYKTATVPIKRKK